MKKEPVNVEYAIVKGKVEAFEDIEHVEEAEFTEDEAQDMLGDASDEVTFIFKEKTKKGS